MTRTTCAVTSTSPPAVFHCISYLSVPYLSLPFAVLSLPYLAFPCLSLSFPCPSLHFDVLSLPFLGLSLHFPAFRCPLPVLHCLSLPYPALPRLSLLSAVHSLPSAVLSLPSAVLSPSFSPPITAFPQVVKFLGTSTDPPLSRPGAWAYPVQTAHKSFFDVDRLWGFYCPKGCKSAMSLPDMRHGAESRPSD